MTDQTTDDVARLREMAKSMNYFWRTDKETLRRAADAMEERDRLKAENARLRGCEIPSAIECEDHKRPLVRINYAHAFGCPECLAQERDAETLEVERLVAAAESTGWNGVENSKILSQYVLDLGEERDRLRKEKDEIVDGVKHAISEILKHSDDNDEFARGLRNHLMGTITDKHGEAYQTELDELQQRNGHLQEAAEVWERNSEDACQLWELLRQVDQEAGNSAAPARRHSLTPILRDDIEKILREKKKPEDRITAIRGERDRLKEAVKDAGFSVMRTSGKWSIHDVSEKAKVEEEQTANVIAENIDLQIEVKRLKEAVKVLRLGLEVVADTNECKYRAEYIAKKLEQAAAILAGEEGEGKSTESNPSR